MNFLVSFVFDCIGALSAALQALFFGLSRGNSDLTAALLSATCLLIILACHDTLIARDHLRRALRSVLVPFAAVFVGQFLIVHLGSQVVPLKKDRIEPVEQGCYRTSLPKELADKLKDGCWLLINPQGRLSPQQWHLADSRMHQKTSRLRVVHAHEGGHYHLSGRNLTFSLPDKSDPRGDSVIVSVVRERGSQHLVSLILCVGYVGWVAWLAFVRVLPLLRNVFALLRRERVLLASVCGFALFFGMHQWRFLSQDARMQMVTSRDDDGYMLQRLQNAVDIRTMDPEKLRNYAYGAIAFYPFALPSFVAGHVGLNPSIEFLNTCVRGSKLLVSLGTLVAVWLLGAGRFGRTAAAAAVLLLATNLGFLSYSSFPFYPDVLMALLSTLSLHFMLKLRARWDARAFSLAVVFAAMSVSVKFLTFLLFPFIIFYGATAVWREHEGNRRGQLAALARCGAMTGVLCVSVFFLCNPYLAYNIEWMVPNYKMCGNYYSAESTQIVVSATAGVKTWIESCYHHGADVSELALALVALVLTPAMWLRHRASAVQRSDDSHGAAGVLLVFALLLQTYLIKSVTLPSAIDRRLLLPVYPIFYLLAVWGVLQLFRFGTAGSMLKRKGVLGTLVAGAALTIVVMPRILVSREFFRHFGKPPESSSVASWLTATGVPNDARIATGLQSWFSVNYGHLTDGIWHPDALRDLFFRKGTLPSVYLEDETYYNQFFSEEAGRRGVNTPEQRQLFEKGSAFYGRLRRNRLAPYLLAGDGQEIVGTNSIGAVTTAFRAYINPLALSENLTASGVITLTAADGMQVVDGLPVSKPGGLSIEWKAPTTVGVVHLSVKDTKCPPLRLKLEDAGGHTDVLPLEALDRDTLPTSEWLLRLSTPRYIVKMSVVSDDGTPAAANRLNALHVLPPAPVGLNVTRYCFEIHDEAGDGSAVDNLISWRPSSHPGLRITPQRAAKFVLKPRIKCDVTTTSIVLDDAPVGACTARCTYVFKDGTRTALEGVEKRTMSPAHVYFNFDCPAGKAVDHIECQVSTTTDATLRQVHVEANPAPQEAGE